MRIVSTWDRPGKVAIDAALDKWKATGSTLDALEKGLAVAEDHPELMAIGRGSLPNSDGEIELDASVMVGSDLSAGAVCALRGVLPAISVARMVMERTKHVMLAGDQARRFAIQNGLEPQNLMTPAAIEAYETWLKRPEVEKTYVHSTDDKPVHDTITMLGMDDQGRFVAASSTSGWSYKLPGRVGDSPIVGAGIYADDEAGCAGATGYGEELWKACASFRAVEHMRHGASAQEACEQVIAQMVRRQPRATEMPCVVLALDKQGRAGAAVSMRKFHLWSTEGGEPTVTEVVPV